MGAVVTAVHRTIFCADIEGFGDRRRTDPDQVLVRDALYAALRGAFDHAGIGWEDCHREDRGDGVLILIPAEVPKRRLITGFLGKLAASLTEHNEAQRFPTRIRLRVALHAGEVQFDDHGVAGSAVNTAFRLLDAEPLKRALADSPGVLAVIASAWFYEEVVRHTPDGAPATYRCVEVSVKETKTAAWVCLPDRPYPPQDEVRPVSAGEIVPRQLPAAPPGFVGRTAELDALTALIDQPELVRTDLVVITAIDGMAGIGKTTLAVRWAHSVSKDFPDGQLYVNLRGFDPSAPPMPWNEAVRGFLNALGVPPERIPLLPEDQAALYRTELSGRRVLVVLDNARHADQVRPLLPGSTGCTVLVTSRNRLTGLIVSDGARPLTLDVLSPAEARELLARHVGRDRLDAEPESTEALLSQCAGLPLALSIVAAHAAIRPKFSLAAIVAQLQDTREGLDGFSVGDPLSDVRAVFSWSYRSLSEPAARIFRLLGLHPGHDITVAAVASLAGIPAYEARGALSELFRSHMIIEHVPGRFGLHDLLRVYATELISVNESEEQQRECVDRLLGHYLHSSFAAAMLLHPRAGPLIVISTKAPAGVTLQTIADYDHAIAWFEAEHAILVATVKLAAATGRHTYAWQVPWTMEEYLDRRGHRNDCILIHKIALASARSEGDLLGEAHAHSGLGRAYHWPRDDIRSRHHYQRSLALFKELGNDVGQAHAHIDLSHILEHEENVGEALRHAEHGLALARDSGDQRAHGRSLYFTGWYLAMLGKATEALSHCVKALEVERAAKDPRGEAFALDALGSAHYRLGDDAEARRFHQEALTLFEGFGDRYGQIKSLGNLGDAHLAGGEPEKARAVWNRALKMINEIGDADVGHIYPGQMTARLRLLGEGR